MMAAPKSMELSSTGGVRSRCSGGDGMGWLEDDRKMRGTLSIWRSCTRHRKQGERLGDAGRRGGHT